MGRGGPPDDDQCHLKIHRGEREKGRMRIRPAVLLHSKIRSPIDRSISKIKYFDRKLTFFIPTSIIWGVSFFFWPDHNTAQFKANSQKQHVQQITTRIDRILPN